jgi:hypothetical protein
MKVLLAKNMPQVSFKSMTGCVVLPNDDIKSPKGAVLRIYCVGQLTTQPVSRGCHDGFRSHFLRRFTMFWTFLLLSALAAVFIKLGAASVMVSVLSMGLQAAVIVIAILAALLLWRKLLK